MIPKLQQFLIPGNTAGIQYRILAADYLVDDIPSWMENQIWIAALGNGHGRILLSELRNKYPDKIIGLIPGPSKKLVEYYISLGFRWDSENNIMFLP